jgi:hypothetical protein
MEQMRCLPYCSRPAVGLLSAVFLQVATIWQFAFRPAHEFSACNLWQACIECINCATVTFKEWAYKLSNNYQDISILISDHKRDMKIKLHQHNKISDIKYRLANTFSYKQE